MNHQATHLLPETTTSISQKLLNVLASPGEVFEEVVASPVNLVNWRLPTLLTCLTGIVLQQSVTQHLSTDVGLVASLTQEQSARYAGTLPILRSLLVCLGTFAGTFWCALILWFIGRVFMRTHFSYLKALEVVSLTGSVAALGAIVTILLIAATGNTAVRPALSLLTGSNQDSLQALNVFHLWATAVLAIGLSKLSGASFREAAFWVFGYWLVARMGLILLS